jgi:hypothetical protein
MNRVLRRTKQGILLAIAAAMIVGTIPAASAQAVNLQREDMRLDRERERREIRGGAQVQLWKRGQSPIAGNGDCPQMLEMGTGEREPGYRADRATADGVILRDSRRDGPQSAKPIDASGERRE